LNPQLKRQRPPVPAPGIGLRSRDLIALLDSAYLWMRVGREPIAEAVLDGLCALAPSWHYPHLARALLAELKEDYRGALTMLRTAQKLSAGQDGSLIHMHLGEVLACLGKLPEARRELKAAIELDPRGTSGQWAEQRLRSLSSTPKMQPPR